jgi:hypothetical protein
MDLEETEAFNASTEWLISISIKGFCLL